MTAAEFWKSLPHCCGFPDCDGDLVAEPHSQQCPLFGRKELTILEFAEAYLAHRQAEQHKTDKQPAKEYKHWLWCNGDRRVPAGEPGHSCSCFNLSNEAIGQAEEWIPVSGEKLPEITEAVLVHSDGFTVPVTARYLGDRRFSSIPGKWEIHAYNWQPLPSPPKQKG